MSTRGLVGIVQDGRWSAIGINSDAYPTWTGEHIATLVQRHGFEVATRGLFMHSDCWHLLVDLPDLTGVTPYGFSTDDVVPVIGWGIGLSERERQEQRGTLVNGEVSLDVHQAYLWAEWGYFFDLDAEVVHVANMGRVGGQVVATLSALDLAHRAINWTEVECGADWSRCPHMADTHERDLPVASKNLSMREWVGLVPISPERAVEARIGMERFTLGQGGSSYDLVPSNRYRTVEPMGFRRLGNWQMAWCQYGTDAWGKSVAVPVHDGHGEPLRGVELTYPPTRAQYQAAATVNT